LEVDRPLVVRRLCPGDDLALADRLAAARFRGDQAFALQDVADRRGRRPAHLGTVERQSRLDLLRPEARIAGAHGDDGCNRLGRHRMRTSSRCPALLLKPVLAAGLAPPLPDVERLAADAVARAQLHDAERPALELPHQRDTLFHRTALPEGHRSNLLVTRTSLICQECSRSTLSGIYPVCTWLPLTPTLSPQAGRGGCVDGSACVAAPHPDPLPARGERGMR